jgi:molybdopterin/thiamine biosynthesis adenylyltransferase
MMMDFEKYQRQISHPKMGWIGQQQLHDAKVLIVGAGGLGCPVLQYLAAAGVGKIGIVDGDVVAKSNLPRQILFTEVDLGMKKVICAEKYLKRMNADLGVVAFPVFINSKNAFEIIHDYDVVVDCSDDFATRYLLNDACILLNKPLVYGAIYGEQGQVAVFNLKQENNFSTNYRDIFPNPPAKGEVPTCEELGVMGVLPGTIGILQANEVIKIITKQSNCLSNKLFMLNLSTYDANTFEVMKNNSVKNPSTITEFEQFDYESFCGASKNEMVL